MKKRHWFHLKLFIPLLPIVVCISYFAQAVTTNAVQAEATAEVEATLSAAYGPEVFAAIEHYEANWLSLDAHQDPNIQSRLATGGYLWYWGYARAGDTLYDEPFWLITKSVTVTYSRVIEYSSEHFKAVAKIEQLVDEMTPNGEFIQSLLEQKHCRFYLFVQETGVWKVADMFDMTIERASNAIGRTIWNGQSKL
jgi:hypothetical protein